MYILILFSVLIQYTHTHTCWLGALPICSFTKIKLQVSMLPTEILSLVSQLARSAPGGRKPGSTSILLQRKAVWHLFKRAAIATSNISIMLTLRLLPIEIVGVSLTLVPLAPTRHRRKKQLLSASTASLFRKQCLWHLSRIGFVHVRSRCGGSFGTPFILNQL